VNLPHLTFHARQRMEKRKISVDDILSALNRRSGLPVPASSGKTWVFGYASEGRILKVLLTADLQTVVTVAWRDEGDE
jgi:hypothetical protein